MSGAGEPAAPAGSDASLEALVSRLKETYEAVTSGRLDPRSLSLAWWSQQAERLFSRPPTAPSPEDGWLERAGEVLRWLSELAALKAQAIAPPPSLPPGEDPLGAEPGGNDGYAESVGELVGLEAAEGETDAAVAWQQAEARYRHLHLAAEALARQAELFGRHLPRPEQAARHLLEALQLLGPWPDQGPGVSPQELALALARVWRRRALAETARQAPAPAMDWPRMMERVREQLKGRPAVGLEELLGQATSRAELIGLFLAVLELVRTGELWLGEEAGQGGIRLGLRASSPPS